MSMHLQDLNRILQDEIHTAEPHLCMQNAATSQVYILVTLIGSAEVNEQTKREAVRFFNLLIDSEEVDFIEDDAFADRLISFIRIGSNVGTMTPDIESEMVELLFAIAARLRQRRTIPFAWFRPNNDTKHLPSTGVTVPKSQEFPLVYMFLEYVHREGKTGDFARTGLLYVLEIAAVSDQLEKWFIESELATMLASGLGALYSQLSSKVALSYAKESVPPILAFSNVTQFDQTSDAESISSAALQANIATFTSFLVFWQDVLERCPSHDIKATLLDHFDFLFLRPLLYPSLVESSDVDNGSSVAVMTYLRYTLENLTHTDIIRLTLHYMLGASAKVVEDSKSSRPSTLARRRKSETLITKNAARIDDPSPDLITLTSIMLGYLGSHNQQTVIASLRLLTTILHSWHEYASTTLMRVQTLQNTTQKRSMSVHEYHLEILYSLAENILEDDGLDGLYESHLQDAQVFVETHPCSIHQLHPPSIDKLDKMIPRAKLPQRTIVPDDPLFKSLLLLLENFLVNDIVVNLTLSETLAALASCGETSLEGWLLGPEPYNLCLRSDDTEREALDRPLADDFTSRHRRDGVSPVLAKLEALVERINKLRRDIQDFDIYLAERRHVFKVGGEIDDELADVSVRRSHDLQGRKQFHSKEFTNASSISEMLEASRNVSRSISPRGRQRDQNLNHPQPKSLVGRLSHLRMSPSPSPSNSPLERTYSPSPLRKQSVSSTASSPLPSPKGPPDALYKKVQLQARSEYRRLLHESGDSETSSMRSESFAPENGSIEENREISLSHLLTNVIILQEFILELAAIIQVRASLFGEVNS
ncbi:MAG: hypothetical protein Q9225_005530 [Loekoesia sp. 1 TL-2023]